MENPSFLHTACYNEYGTLRTVLLCPAQYMEIREVINQTQKRYAQEDIDTALAREQHQSFVEALTKQNVETIILAADENFPEQVFARDIGFTIGDTFFLANMEQKIRQGEEKVLAQWLLDQKMPFTSIRSGSIEGGDVLIHQDIVWVGASDRTSPSAIHELQKQLPHHKVITVPFANEYLHLDCVFNILSANEALIFPDAFAKKDVERLSSHFHLIEVSPAEQFTLGTNVFSIGEKTVFSLPLNKKVNRALEKRGYKVIRVDISEIIKSGGSFRCMTLPLLRDR